MNLNRVAVLVAVISLCTIVHIVALDRVAVVPFAAGDGVNPFIGTETAHTFRMELESSEQYEVISEMEFFAAMESLSMQNVQNIDENVAARLGKKVNADKIFIGIVTNEGDKLTLSIKCIDVSIGKEIISEKVSLLQSSLMHSERCVSSLCRMIVSQINNGDTRPCIFPNNMTERQIIHIDRLTRNGVDISNGSDMKQWFHYYLRMGIAGAIIDGVLMTIAATELGVMGGLLAAYPTGNYMMVGGIVAGALFAVDWIVAPILMVIGFVRMGRTYAIFRKVTGNKKFDTVPQISFGGGYNWEDKEVALSMAVKL